jgi:hypothetical protein
MLCLSDCWKEVENKIKENCQHSSRFCGKALQLISKNKPQNTNTAYRKKFIHESKEVFWSRV